MGIKKPTKSIGNQLQAINKWLGKSPPPEPKEHEPFHDEIKHIKNILKDRDTQNNLLPLKFHRYVKPPVEPDRRFLTQKRVVAGKRVPFTHRWS
ncbi:hypothetical protein LEN26_000875 [Aphanomyces euteiches]|nr:hypothetical protein AeMF1_011738 [Aphanomyces euteiches]KAH9162618.1 hypothetical protein LEN26_000875 [Aphanomyces euteiches]KAH9180134.1 hypothetical protein AeNC1_017222 [Aphanomyces euteiches]